MSEKKVNISAQVTPNPNTLKFMLDINLFETGTYNFISEDAAEGSYLPEVLFDIEGVVGVMVGTNFVSVTKDQKTDWSDIAEEIVSGIEEAVESGETLIDESKSVQHKGGSSSEIETKIKAILDSEIRPAVAMDGGDITFHSFKDGVLMLQMEGACSGCPSSTLTLKMGIENRLKEEIPELIEVVQI